MKFLTNDIAPYGVTFLLENSTGKLIRIYLHINVLADETCEGIVAGVGSIA